MIGGDEINGAVGERSPEGRLIFAFTHWRIDADHPGEAGVVVRRQHQVMRAGFAGDVDTARFSLAQRPQLFGR